MSAYFCPEKRIEKESKSNAQIPITPNVRARLLYACEWRHCSRCWNKTKNLRMCVSAQAKRRCTIDIMISLLLLLFPALTATMQACPKVSPWNNTKCKTHSNGPAMRPGSRPLSLCLPSHVYSIDHFSNLTHTTNPQSTLTDTAHTGRKPLPDSVDRRGLGKEGD